MKELSGSGSGVTPASIDECVRFFCDVDRYPTWHPDVVRSVEVLDRDGNNRPTRARAVLHVAVGPLVKDFNLILAVTVEEPSTVKLTRVPHHAGDEERFSVTWRLVEAGGTRIGLELEALLPIPRFVPIGGIGDLLAKGFVTDAVKALGG